MRAETLHRDAARPGSVAGQRRYIRGMLAVARSARRGEYALVHLASGSFLRTDHLGAVAARALIAGESDVETAQRVDRIEAGAGGRAERLIDALASKAGAMTSELPAKTEWRWWIRRAAASGAGISLSVLGPSSRHAPIALLAWFIKALPTTWIGNHVWRGNRFSIVHNLLTSGYADSRASWLSEVGRRSAGEHARGHVFNYLSIGMPERRIARLVDRLFEAGSVDSIVERLEVDGPAIGVFLHGPLCVAVPHLLRNRGQDVVRVVVPRTHGINVSERSGPVSDFFGDPSERSVDADSPLATGSLLRQLKAGRSVYVALDRVAAQSNQARIQMLGQRFERNDGPAWLAVRSGRPVSLWTTHASDSGIAIKASAFFHPDHSLPLDRQVADLSERLYRCAELAIRQHPEAWWCWSYLDLVKGPSSGSRR